MANDRTAIKDFYGRILGYLTPKDGGDIQATDFYGRILGFYRKGQNNTVDFYGRIIGSGDLTSALIYQNAEAHK